MLSPMLSVVIPTLNAATTLPATLAALAASDGLVSEIVVSDGGSADATAALARAAGCRVVAGPRGRGLQLAAGAAAARGEWLLFLHADTCLAAGWPAAVRGFCAAPANHDRAGYFRFALADDAPAARRLEALVRWRCGIFALPYGDQGLVLRAATYRALGGFAPLPLMEDVDFARRLGRARLVALPATAVTSAQRYRRGGYWARPVRNLVCLGLYFAGLPPRHLVKLYG